LDKNLNLIPKVTKIYHYASGIATEQQKGDKLIIAQRVIRQPADIPDDKRINGKDFSEMQIKKGEAPLALKRTWNDISFQVHQTNPGLP
jgi:hypothetical protein